MHCGRGSDRSVLQYISAQALSTALLPVTKYRRHAPQSISPPVLLGYTFLSSCVVCVLLHTHEIPNAAKGSRVANKGSSKDRREAERGVQCLRAVMMQVEREGERESGSPPEVLHSIVIAGEGEGEREGDRTASVAFCPDTHTLCIAYASGLHLHRVSISTEREREGVATQECIVTSTPLPLPFPHDVLAFTVGSVHVLKGAEGERAIWRLTLMLVPESVESLRFLYSLSLSLPSEDQWGEREDGDAEGERGIVCVDRTSIVPLCLRGESEDAPPPSSLSLQSDSGLLIVSSGVYATIHGVTYASPAAPSLTSLSLPTGETESVVGNMHVGDAFPALLQLGGASVTPPPSPTPPKRSNTGTIRRMMSDREGQMGRIGGMLASIGETSPCAIPADVPPCAPTLPLAPCYKAYGFIPQSLATPLKTSLPLGVCDTPPPVSVVEAWVGSLSLSLRVHSLLPSTSPSGSGPSHSQCLHGHTMRADLDLSSVISDTSMCVHSIRVEAVGVKHEAARKQFSAGAANWVHTSDSSSDSSDLDSDSDSDSEKRERERQREIEEGKLLREQSRSIVVTRDTRKLALRHSVKETERERVVVPGVRLPSLGGDVCLVSMDPDSECVYRIHMVLGADGEEGVSPRHMCISVDVALATLSVMSLPPTLASSVTLAPLPSVATVSLVHPISVEREREAEVTLGQRALPGYLVTLGSSVSTPSSPAAAYLDICTTCEKGSPLSVPRRLLLSTLKAGSRGEGSRDRDRDVLSPDSIVGWEVVSVEAANPTMPRRTSLSQSFSLSATSIGSPTRSPLSAPSTQSLVVSVLVYKRDGSALLLSNAKKSAARRGSRAEPRGLFPLSSSGSSDTLFLVDTRRCFDRHDTLGLGGCLYLSASRSMHTTTVFRSGSVVSPSKHTCAGGASPLGVVASSILSADGRHLLLRRLSVSEKSGSLSLTVYPTARVSLSASSIAVNHGSSMEVSTPATENTPLYRIRQILPDTSTGGVYILVNQAVFRSGPSGLTGTTSSIECVHEVDCLLATCLHPDGRLLSLVLPDKRESKSTKTDSEGDVLLCVGDLRDAVTVNVTSALPSEVANTLVKALREGSECVSMRAANAGVDVVTQTAGVLHVSIPTRSPAVSVGALVSAYRTTDDPSGTPSAAQSVTRHDLSVQEELLPTLEDRYYPALSTAVDSMQRDRDTESIRLMEGDHLDKNRADGTRLLYKDSVLWDSLGVAGRILGLSTSDNTTVVSTGTGGKEAEPLHFTLNPSLSVWFQTYRSLSMSMGGDMTPLHPWGTLPMILRRAVMAYASLHPPLPSPALSSKKSTVPVVCADSCSVRHSVSVGNALLAYIRTLPIAVDPALHPTLHTSYEAPSLAALGQPLSRLLPEGADAFTDELSLSLGQTGDEFPASTHATLRGRTPNVATASPMMSPFQAGAPGASLPPPVPLSLFLSLRMGLWLPASILKAYTLSVCSYEFSVSRDPDAVSPFLLLLGEQRKLSGMYRTKQNGKIADFLLRDFSVDKNLVAASKNAFTVLGRGDTMRAVGWFALANMYEDAVLLAGRRSHDASLCVLAYRLYLASGKQVKATPSAQSRKTVGAGGESEVVTGDVVGAKLLTFLAKERDSDRETSTCASNENSLLMCLVKLSQDAHAHKGVALARSALSLLDTAGSEVMTGYKQRLSKDSMDSDSSESLSVMVERERHRTLSDILCLAHTVKEYHKRLAFFDKKVTSSSVKYLLLKSTKLLIALLGFSVDHHCRGRPHHSMSLIRVLSTLKECKEREKEETKAVEEALQTMQRDLASSATQLEGSTPLGAGLRPSAPPSSGFNLMRSVAPSPSPIGRPRSALTNGHGHGHTSRWGGPGQSHLRQGVGRTAASPEVSASGSSETPTSSSMETALSPASTSTKGESDVGSGMLSGFGWPSQNVPSKPLATLSPSPAVAPAPLNPVADFGSGTLSGWGSQNVPKKQPRPQIERERERESVRESSLRSMEAVSPPGPSESSSQASSARPTRPISGSDIESGSFNMGSFGFRNVPAQSPDVSADMSTPSGGDGGMDSGLLSWGAPMPTPKQRSPKGPVRGGVPPAPPRRNATPGGPFGSFSRMVSPSDQSSPESTVSTGTLSMKGWGGMGGGGGIGMLGRAANRSSVPSTPFTPHTPKGRHVTEGQREAERERQKEAQHQIESMKALVEKTLDTESSASLSAPMVDVCGSVVVSLVSDALVSVYKRYSAHMQLDASVETDAQGDEVDMTRTTLSNPASATDSPFPSHFAKTGPLSHARLSAFVGTLSKHAGVSVRDILNRAVSICGTVSSSSSGGITPQDMSLVVTLLRDSVCDAQDAITRSNTLASLGASQSSATSGRGSYKRGLVSLMEKHLQREAVSMAVSSGERSDHKVWQRSLTPLSVALSLLAPEETRARSIRSSTMGPPSLDSDSSSDSDLAPLSGDSGDVGVDVLSFVPVGAEQRVLVMDEMSSSEEQVLSHSEDESSDDYVREAPITAKQSNIGGEIPFGSSPGDIVISGQQVSSQEYFSPRTDSGPNSGCSSPTASRLREDPISSPIPASPTTLVGTVSRTSSPLVSPTASSTLGASTTTRTATFLSLPVLSALSLTTLPFPRVSGVDKAVIAYEWLARLRMGLDGVKERHRSQETMLSSCDKSATRTSGVFVLDTVQSLCAQRVLPLHIPEPVHTNRVYSAIAAIPAFRRVAQAVMGGVSASDESETAAFLSVFTPRTMQTPLGSSAMNVLNGVVAVLASSVLAKKATYLMAYTDSATERPSAAATALMQSSLRAVTDFSLTLSRVLFRTLGGGQRHRDISRLISDKIRTVLTEEHEIEAGSRPVIHLQQRLASFMSALGIVLIGLDLATSPSKGTTLGSIATAYGCPDVVTTVPVETVSEEAQTETEAPETIDVPGAVFVRRLGGAFMRQGLMRPVQFGERMDVPSTTEDGSKGLDCHVPIDLRECISPPLLSSLALLYCYSNSDHIRRLTAVLSVCSDLIGHFIDAKALLQAEGVSTDAHVLSGRHRLSGLVFPRHSLLNPSHDLCGRYNHSLYGARVVLSKIAQLSTVSAQRITHIGTLSVPIPSTHMNGDGSVMYTPGSKIRDLVIVCTQYAVLEIDASPGVEESGSGVCCSPGGRERERGRTMLSRGDVPSGTQVGQSMRPTLVKRPTSYVLPDARERERDRARTISGALPDTTSQLSDSDSDDVSQSMSQSGQSSSLSSREYSVGFGSKSTIKRGMGKKRGSFGSMTSSLSASLSREREKKRMVDREKERERCLESVVDRESMSPRREASVVLKRSMQPTAMCMCPQLGGYLIASRRRHTTSALYLAIPGQSDLIAISGLSPLLPDRDRERDHIVSISVTHWMGCTVALLGTKLSSLIAVRLPSDLTLCPSVDGETSLVEHPSFVSLDLDSDLVFALPGVFVDTSGKPAPVDIIEVCDPTSLLVVCATKAPTSTSNLLVCDGVGVRAGLVSQRGKASFLDWFQGSAPSTPRGRTGTVSRSASTRTLTPKNGRRDPTSVNTSSALVRPSVAGINSYREEFGHSLTQFRVLPGGIACLASLPASTAGTGAGRPAAVAVCGSVGRLVLLDPNTPKIMHEINTGLTKIKGACVVSTPSRVIGSLTPLVLPGVREGTGLSRDFGKEQDAWSLTGETASESGISIGTTCLLLLGSKGRMRMFHCASPDLPLICDLPCHPNSTQKHSNACVCVHTTAVQRGSVHGGLCMCPVIVMASKEGAVNAYVPHG
ncbi:hypothetical protein KIPB_003504 [Kipferlia bialata]|uniref:RAVE complex protein Rav1 C-terminal domain-containing protein n=1 Tax=Kipferlia bialata TaxID=797122 RepID=A0A9K3GGP8_9EUKA|nr:hypothetical protein KIPB_003504 [Kipferlia bialata]|eukprot:g3504.t1